MGDRLLSAFGDLVRCITRSEDIIGRIGKDEFIIFYKNTVDDQDIQRIIARINEQIVGEARRLMGTDMNIPIGVSAGFIYPDIQVYCANNKDIYISVLREYYECGIKYIKEQRTDYIAMNHDSFIEEYSKLIEEIKGVM